MAAMRVNGFRGSSLNRLLACLSPGASRVVLATVLVLAAAMPGVALPVRGDFNGDGYADLAIGAPGENNSAGVVHVLYGSAAGLQALGVPVRGGAPAAQFWSQASTGLGDRGGSESGDHFGFALSH